MILRDPFSFLAFSFLVCRQARQCSDIPRCSPHITVGLFHFEWEQKTLIHYIVEGLGYSHFLGKEVKNLEFLLRLHSSEGNQPV